MTENKGERNKKVTYADALKKSICGKNGRLGTTKERKLK